MNLTDALIDLLLFFFLIVSVLMCLVVLMQRGKQEGLGAAFGGGLMDSTFGPQTSNVLVKTTVILAALFFLLSISLARLYTHKAYLSEKTTTSPITQELLGPTPAPAKSATPAAPATPAPSTPAPAPTSSATPTPAPVPTAPAPAAPTKPAAK